MNTSSSVFILQRIAYILFKINENKLSDIKYVVYFLRKLHKKSNLMRGCFFLKSKQYFYCFNKQRNQCLLIIFCY